MAEPAHTQEATEHASGGLPQFDPAWWPGQIVWVLIIFAVLYAVLSKLVLPRVGGAIENRATTIANDIADARALRDEAQAQAAEAEGQTKAARAAAMKTASDAKALATAEAAARDAEQEAELNAKLETAEAQIRAARDKAMKNVSTIAVETAQAITAKLTGKAATEAEVKSALAKIA
jgi:F-type H+-transporting ATPase subunit b